MKITTILFFTGLLGLEASNIVETLRLQPAAHMTRAELHYLQIDFQPEAILILCPGVNGDGKRLIRSRQWIDFAKENKLGLVGLSFASPLSAIHDGTGYYYPSYGSGEKLLEGIREIYQHDLPLILYGFSGGAHFTSRFVEWRSDRVLAWCAYSAGWWDMPTQKTLNPPGIVACGEKDTRNGASMIYFKQGRAVGKPWLWVSVPGTGHSEPEILHEFVRNYFVAILRNEFVEATYIDIERKSIVDQEEAITQPSLTAWLPSRRLFDEWKEIHEP